MCFSVLIVFYFESLQRAEEIFGWPRIHQKSTGISKNAPINSNRRLIWRYYQSIEFYILHWSFHSHFFIPYVKNSISWEQRPEGINPFQIFHTLSRSSYGPKMDSKRLGHLGRFPREIWVVGYFCEHCPRSRNQIARSITDSCTIVSDLSPISYMIIQDHTENRTQNRSLRNLISIPTLSYV